MTTRNNIKRALKDCGMNETQVRDTLSRIESFGEDGIAIIIQDGEIHVRGNYKMNVKVLNCDKLSLSHDDVEARREEVEEIYPEVLKEIYLHEN